MTMKLSFQVSQVTLLHMNQLHADLVRPDDFIETGSDIIESAYTAASVEEKRYHSTSQLIGHIQIREPAIMPKQLPG